MSQPAGIITKVKISEENYKKFIKQEAKNIAEEMFSSFWHKISNVYLFRYNKKQATLYSFVYYNHGNSETLKESAIYKSVNKIGPFLDIDSEGYFFATLDSLNFGDFITEQKIENKEWKDYKFSNKETDTIWKEAKKKFFNRVEDVSDFNAFFNKNRSFMDKSILKCFSVLQEEARIKTVKEELPNATPLKPAQIFKGYFYNGSQFYYCDGFRKITYFENINLQNLEEKEYGLTDGEHIIIGEKVINANPKYFKKLHKFYTTFYKTESEVFDENLTKIENADAKTFKLTTYKRDIADLYFGEDASHLFYLNEIINKEELGDFYFSEALFYSETLLIGSKKIYLGAKCLNEIDALTFEKLSLQKNKTEAFLKEKNKDSSSSNGMKELLIFGKDKYGEIVIFQAYTNNAKKYFIETSFGFKNREPKVLRMNQDEFLDFYKKYKNELLENVIPTFNDFIPKDNLKSEEYYEKFNSFFDSPHFQNLLNENKYSYDFLRKFNNYLGYCWQLYSEKASFFKGKDKTFLEQGLSNYKKIKSEYIAELNPYIFHHLACFSVALDQLDEAMEYVTKAFYYGYEKFHLMLDDEDLKPLFKHKDFIKLKKWYQENVKETRVFGDWRFLPNTTGFPFLNEWMVTLLEKIPDELKNGTKYSIYGVDYVKYIMINTFIYDVIENPNDENAYYNPLIKKFAPYFNKYLQNTIDLSWQSGCTYNFYQNYTITNAKSHLARLEYMFYNAHNEYGVNAMTEEAVNDLVNKIKIKYEEADAEDKNYINNSKILNLLRIKI